MFSTYDCADKGIRKKEDPYNAIIAGFLTGGSLAIRGGFRAARNSAIMCAIFLAVIEGVGIGFQRAMADNTNLNVRCDLSYVCRSMGTGNETDKPIRYHLHLHHPTRREDKQRWLDNIRHINQNYSPLISTPHCVGRLW